MAVQIAKRYEAALLSINSIVLEAISNGNTPAGLKARELCAEAARKAEELKAAEGEGADAAVQDKKGGLSMEAVAAHTQGTGPHDTSKGATSTIMTNKKTSTVSDPKSKGGKLASDTGKTGEGASQVSL